jgi:beta-galactosidase
MEPITFDRVCYRIGGRPVFLYSGEFHYFRVPKKDWKERLTLFKQAGGNCVATYIPWMLHEPEEGRFVFGGEDGVCDLEGFLRTAQEVGLYVIARPGPYQYSELKYGGLPAWLFERFPEILARRIDGSPVSGDAVSYLHPVFLEKVRAWFDRVCPVLARYTVANGGCIAFTQVDNELTGIQLWRGSCDFNRQTMGFGDPQGRFARFLEAKYGGVEAVNRLYGLDCASLAQVPPAVPGADPSPEGIRRGKDYFDFYLGTVAEYARTLQGMLREHGVDTPLIHNSGNPDMNAYFLETVRALGQGFLLGSDHYYNLNQSWAQNNPTPQYARKVFFSCEMLRLMGFPPTVLEMPSGSASDWPPITPVDSKACYLVNLAFGMKGCNYYIFTGGPNPEGAGETTDLYDYHAPVGARGEIRPLYGVQKELGNYLRENAWLAESERAHDCRIALDFEYARAPKYWDGGDFPFTPPEAWEFLIKGVLTTALCAGASPVFADLGGDDWPGGDATPVLAVSSVSMARAKQEKLVRFLKAGGKLLIAPLLPMLDENLLPCTVLADFLGSPRMLPPSGSFVRPTIAGVANVARNGVFCAAGLPADAEILGVEESSGGAAAFSVATQGGGEAVVLGLHWHHAMREQEKMLLALLGKLGFERRVSCSSPEIWTSLRTAGGKAVLFAMNLWTSPVRAALKVAPLPGLPEGRDFGERLLPPMTVEILPL